jgi:UDP-glucuronate decarboxylase
MPEHDGRVVPTLITQALSGEDLTIFGQGDQTRSFCYVDDLIEAILRFMQAPDDLIGPTNLGNPAEITILDLAQLVLELTGSRSRIVQRPLPQDVPDGRRPDVRLARERLDWEPRVSLREGLQKTIAYYRNASTLR